MAILINGAPLPIQPKEVAWEANQPITVTVTGIPIYNKARILTLTFGDGMSDADFQSLYNLYTTNKGMVVPITLDDGYSAGAGIYNGVVYEPAFTTYWNYPQYRTTVTMQILILP